MFFYSQSDAAAASRLIGGITYTANTVGSAGNNIAITHVQGAAATSGTKATTSIVHSGNSGPPMNMMTSANFTVTAKNAGTSGNRLRIAFSGFGIAGGAATYSANQVGGTKDVITVPGSSPTLAQIRQSLAASPASTYVDVSAISGVAPTGGMFVSGVTYDLSGGTAAVSAESTAVTVNTPTAITVRIAAAEFDVATVAAVVNAAGTSVTASGTGTITDKNITLLLQGGAD